MCIYSYERRAYPSDVTDEEWAILEPLIPQGKKGGTASGDCTARDRECHFLRAA